MGLFSKFQSGLFKTRDKISAQVKALLTGQGKLTDEVLEDLEECLITSDISVEIATAVCAKIRKACLGQELSSTKLVEYLEQFTSEYLAEPIPDAITQKPHVILVLGVNGVGKTTSIAKIAAYYKGKGLSPLVAAGDTFRAGAIAQIEEWCRRVGVDIVKHEEGSDAAAVAYDAYQAAKARQKDLLIIDTAGRLHNKDNLMDELKKMVRVLQKHDPHLPHETLLVIDGNTGQNAIAQAKAFNLVHPIQGLVVTKLDGTAKGGALIATSHQTKIPVKWVGVGEGQDDLLQFSKKAYVHSMFSDVEIDLPQESEPKGILGVFKGFKT